MSVFIVDSSILTACCSKKMLCLKKKEHNMSWRYKLYIVFLSCFYEEHQLLWTPVLLSLSSWLICVDHQTIKDNIFDSPESNLQQIYLFFNLFFALFPLFCCSTYLCSWSVFIPDRQNGFFLFFSALAFWDKSVECGCFFHFRMN